MLGFFAISQAGISYLSSGATGPAMAEGITPGWKGGGHVDPYRDYKEKEYQREKLAKKHAELKALNQRIAEAEQDKRDKLLAAEKSKAKNAAKNLAALEARLQEEISRLRIERDWLIRVINDEETILVLLLCYPLH
jgi:hypothetical protein